MFRHMLVPLDHSALARKLGEYAVAMARLNGADITFLSVCEDFGSTSEGALQRSLSPEGFVELAVHGAETTLKWAFDLASSQGVASTSNLRVGNHPYQEIIAEAKASNCDVVVMASHGRHGLERLVIGSQTQKVLNLASIPVLVVPLTLSDKHG
jgi:nucleotide-binding universal stress UspA family protein